MELDSQMSEPHSIISYDEKSVVIAGKNLNFPCMITNENYQNIANLESVIDDIECELLIIGSNTSYTIKQQFEIKQKVNTEFMNITSAIYCFNLMLSDKRDVVLMIL